MADIDKEAFQVRPTRSKKGLVMEKLYQNYSHGDYPYDGRLSYEPSPPMLRIGNPRRYVQISKEEWKGMSLDVPAQELADAIHELVHLDDLRILDILVKHGISWSEK